MPDPLELLQAMVIAALVAAAMTSLVLLFSRFPARPPNATCLAFGSALGVGLAIAVGCWLLQGKPRWSLDEDQDRLLGLLLPVAVVVECLASIRSLPTWMGWTLRALLAVVAAPALLHGSRYLAEVPGLDVRPWDTLQTVEFLGAMAVGLALVWGLLSLLARRLSGLSLPLVLALAATLLVTGMTLMLSGYLSGGELGLPMAAALAGAGVVVTRSAPAANTTAIVGIGVVGLFGLLVIGRFFGSLTTEHALLLGFAPLLAWLPELPGVRTLRPVLRGGIGVALVLLPLALVLHEAKNQSDLDNQATGASEGEPTLQDYLNFGK